MEKLELKHLAPYLPYGLKVYIITSNDVLEILSLNKVLFRNQIFIETINGAYGSLYFKPILRPLSDLTKRFNGDSCFITYMWYSIISTDSDCFDKDDFFEKCELGMVDHLPYMVIPFLLENHFDVFGLIEKGLAIDINTL